MLTEKIFKWLLVSWLVLALLDVTTTFYGVSVLGGNEGNPLWAVTIANIDLWAYPVMLVSTVTGLCIMWRLRRLRLMHLGLAIFVVLGALVVINNIGLVVDAICQGYRIMWYKSI